MLFEERERGITINTAHVEYETENVTTPGPSPQGHALKHDHWCRQWEPVVASTDGPMPQTSRRAHPSRQVGVKHS